MKVWSEKTKYSLVGIVAILAMLPLAGNFHFANTAKAALAPQNNSVSDVSLGFGGSSSSGISTRATNTTLQLSKNGSAFEQSHEFTTGQVQADYNFNALAVTWKIDQPQGTHASFYMQTTANGVTSNWLPLPENEDMQDPDTKEHFSELNFVSSGATSFAIKAVLSTSNQAVTPIVSDIQAHYLDSRPGPQMNFSSIQTKGAVTTPRVISRAEWGADESIMDWTPQYSAPKKFIIHHTAGAQGGSDPASVIRGIYRYHAVTRGWGDIGYNYVADEHGNIYEGRYGGNGVIGAHALRTESGGSSVSYNPGSIGISVLGNYDNDTVTTATKNALINFIGYKGIQNNINPTTVSYFVDRNMPGVIGHRDVDYTSCPGTDLYADVAEIRNGAQAAINATPHGDYNPYAAELNSVPDLVNLEDKNWHTVTVKIKNTGDALWSNSGPNAVVLQTADPANRNSVFYDSSWLASYRPAKLKEASVPPGGIGTFSFVMRDSRGLEADYDETFKLVASGLTWIDGSQFTLHVHVSLRYKAQIDELPGDGNIDVAPGQKTTVAIWMKNIGTRAWTKTGPNFVALNLQDPAGRSSAFYDSASWPLSYRPTLLSSPDTLNPGEWGYFKFILKAPTTTKVYNEGFQAVSEGITWITGSHFTLHVNVIGPYKGEVVSVTPGPTLDVNETQEITARIKNTGSATWKNSGSNFIALNVNNPPGKNSAIKDPATWTEYPYRPGRMTTAEVRPGQVGEFDFTIKAPKTAGTYKEYFQAVAENVTWIAGTSFDLTVRALNPYEGQITAKSPETIIMEDHASRDLSLTIKNIGSETWHAGDGLYTAPGGRVSPFQDITWPAGAVDILDHDVVPGASATFNFRLNTPDQMVGSYTESFYMKSAGQTVLSTTTNFYITVTPRYNGQVTSQTATEITVSPGSRTSFTFNYKNTGTRTWSNTGDAYVSLQTTNPANRHSTFEDSSWPAYYRPTVMDSTSVAPNATGTFTFYLQAPDTTGDYTEQFKLTAQGVAWMPSSTGTIRIHVRSTLSEPTIKIGIAALSQVQVSGNGAFRAVKGGDGSLLGTFASGNVATVTVEGGNSYYRLAGPGVNVTTTDYVRFIPNTGTILKVYNYHDHPGFNTSLDDNTFRGNILAWRSGSTGNFWAINELKMEDYLKGIAEQSDSTTYTHLKTMSVAERTYAYYNVQRGGKHANEHFDLNNTSGDQVYKGYGLESRSPHIVQAVNETKGQMVTYRSAIALTPYFSRSDGRTRSYQEVWGGTPGAYPYLVSVDDHWSSPGPMNGHGVGLSGYGALQQANEGRSYTQILQHYYTGVQITDYY